MPITLFSTVWIDLTAWILCSLALVTFARLSASHPATPYLIFHGWFISARTLAILNGAPTLFSWPGGEPVITSEISRAVLVADAALIAMTCAWILAAYRNAWNVGNHEEIAAVPLRIEIIRSVVALAIPVGLLAMLLWSKVPGIDRLQVMPNWGGSNWAVVAQTWMGLGLLGLVYIYGFRWSLLLPLAAYFAIALYQGNFRFRLLIPRSCWSKSI